MTAEEGGVYAEFRSPAAFGNRVGMRLCGYLLLGGGLASWLLPTTVLEIHEYCWPSSAENFHVGSQLAYSIGLPRSGHSETSMSLNEVWEGAAGSPFYPTVSKDWQFFVASSLLLAGELFFCADRGKAGLKLIYARFCSDWPLRIE